MTSIPCLAGRIDQRFVFSPHFHLEGIQWGKCARRVGRGKSHCAAPLGALRSRQQPLVIDVISLQTPTFLPEERLDHIGTRLFEHTGPYFDAMIVQSRLK